VKSDEALNPVDVRLLGAQAVVLDADAAAHAVEQARGAVPEWVSADGNSSGGGSNASGQVGRITATESGKTMTPRLWHHQ
jgi:hypothetical protein